MFFLMSFLFIHGLNESPTLAGLHLALIPIALGLVAPITGSIYARVGATPGAVERLSAHGVPIELGPVPRRGARGVDGTSVYFRDPDGNLLEFMSYD